MEIRWFRCRVAFTRLPSTIAFCILSDTNVQYARAVRSFSRLSTRKKSDPPAGSNPLKSPLCARTHAGTSCLFIDQINTTNTRAAAAAAVDRSRRVQYMFRRFSLSLSFVYTHSFCEHWRTGAYKSRTLRRAVKQNRDK